MGTYRSLEHFCTCLCGSGTFQIDYCEVDHSWPTSRPQWHSPHVNCAACAEKYEIQERSKTFYVIEKEKIRQLELLSHQATVIENELLLSNEVDAIKVKFSHYLSAQKSITAIHRVLSEAELVSMSIGTFRKRWTEPNEWLKSHLRASNLINISSILSLPSEHIAHIVQEIERLRTQAYVQPEPYGDAIYKCRT